MLVRMWASWSPGALLGAGWAGGGGCNMVQPPGQRSGISSVGQIQNHPDPALPALGVCPQEPRAETRTHTCTATFTATLFPVAKGGTNPSAHQGKHKLDVVCPDPGILFSLKAGVNVGVCTTWMDLENLVGRLEKGVRPSFCQGA